MSTPQYHKMVTEVADVDNVSKTASGHVVWKFTLTDGRSFLTKANSFCGLEVTGSERGWYTFELENGRIIGFAKSDSATYSFYRI
jgi:hypothetical protein